MRWARQSAGRHLDEAARGAHVAANVVAQWERGDSAPTARPLEQLADKYKRAVVVLLRAEPPTEPALPVDFRRLPNGRPVTLSADSRLAIRRARRAQRVFRGLVPTREVAAPLLLPTHLRRDPEKAAAF